MAKVVPSQLFFQAFRIYEFRHIKTVLSEKMSYENPIDKMNNMNKR